MQKKTSKIKHVFSMFIKCILAGIVAMAILSGFCYFFSYSGTRVANETGATDFKWSPNEFKSNAFEGFSWLNMDEHGFNNINDCSESPDILLMGSSHMEACNVGKTDSVAYKLSDKLSLDVYNISMSAHTIYNCVNNMESAVKEYNPGRYVILETLTTELSVNEMQKVIDGTYTKYESYDSGMLYWLQKYIPALKNIYKQVGVWSGDTNKAIGAEADSSETIDENYETVLYNFLSKAKISTEKNGAKLIIFYHPEIKIDENANAYTKVINQQRFNLFEKTCKKLDIIYVDMTETFINMYEQQHILPYGFYNTAVGAAHLNERGHEAIAEKLSKIISEDK